MGYGRSILFMRNIYCVNFTPHCSEVSVQHRGVQLRADDPGAGLHRDGQAAGGRGLGRGRCGSGEEVEGCDGHAKNAQP